MDNMLPSKIRPAYETWAAISWLFVILFCIKQIVDSNGVTTPYYYVMAASSVFFFYYSYKALDNLYARARLLGRPFKFITPQYLLNHINKNKDKLWLGWGYDWLPENTQDAYEIDKVNEDEWKPNWFVVKFFSLFGLVNKPYGADASDRPNGQLWIHGLEKEKNLYVPIRDLAAHSLILGTTGSGKTRLYESLLFSAIHRGEVVIVLDPKGDQELRERIQKECTRAGRDQSFAYFHPAHPSSSVRIDPLVNWNRGTEIASRLVALMGEGRDPVFKAFAWKAINTLAMAMVRIGIRPNISNILRLLESGPDDLVIRVLEKHFDEIELDWRDPIRDYEIKAQRAEFNNRNADASKEAIARVEFYKEKIKDEDKEREVESLITMFLHSREHFAKLIAGLLPVLSKLNSDGLDQLLSPTERTGDEDRPILNSSSIIDQGMVLYVGLDSLADSEVSAAIGSILLADLTAVAASRYNFGVDDTRISLFVDEAAEVVSPEFLQLLNKARGAGFSIFFASQSIADFESRLGAKSKAMQIIANANNLIALRVKDKETLEFVAEKFGETAIKTFQVTQSTNAIGSDRDVTNYTGGYGERSTDVTVPSVSEEMLANLPNLEYFASLSAGRVIKGRLPLFEQEEMPSYKDQFWLRRDV